MHLILIILLSFCFGISQKLADLFDEHGWKASQFVAHAVGIIWGVVGSALVLLDVYSALVITSTVLYWLFRHKLDYLNHTFAGSIVLLVSLYQFGRYPHMFAYLTVFFLWYVVTGTYSSYLRNKYPENKFLRLRLWIYTGPLILSIIIGNYIPFITVLSGMLGTELMAYRHVKMNLAH